MTTIVFNRSDVNELKRKFPVLPLSKDTPAARLSRIKLRNKIEKETDYEPPAAYYSALWDSAELGKSHKTVLTYNAQTDTLERARRTKNLQTMVKVKVQGSVVAVKARRIKPDQSRVFERGWDSELTGGGDSMAAEAKRTAIAAPSSSGNKNSITEFSKASRRNLQEKMCSLKLDVWLRAWFLTLTYHNDYPNPQGAKAHLRAFYKRIYRYAAEHGHKVKPSIIWRVEPQRRGAPHFHLFVFNAPKIPKYMLLQWWQEITGDETITQIDREFLTTRRKAMNYLSKYISKDKYGAFTEGEARSLDIALYWAKAGRYWGSEGLTEDMFAEVKELVCEIVDGGLRRFVEMLENTFPHLLERWSFGFKIFTYDKPAYSIWDMANLLITGELIDTVSGGGLHNASYFEGKDLVGAAVG